MVNWQQKIIWFMEIKSFLNFKSFTIMAYIEYGKKSKVSTLYADTSVHGYV